VHARLGIIKLRLDSNKATERTQKLNEVQLPEGVQIDKDDEGIFWTIKTPYVHLVLNARRGLAIKSLAFKSHNYEPVLGTLPQGYFNTIDLGADFYSGGVIIEIPGDQSRVTDLEWVTPLIMEQGNHLLISAKIPLSKGFLEKTIAVDVEAEKVRLTYEFQEFKRPLGIVRVGIITIFPECFSFPIAVSCLNGGETAEWFQLDQVVDHGQAASTLVSSTSALGATDGLVVFKDASNRKLLLRWNPANCAAIPMLKHQRVKNRHLTRISFSLCELDDTLISGGNLLPFSFELKGEE